ncbi:MAG: phosphopantetheine-binding protein, partial [Psychrosphaera sp.]|nr:phosphopantetheine-binding protein [Psychrosphaera sp.]
LGENLWHSVQNASQMNIVSGTHEAIETLAAQLTEKGIGVVELHTSHAFHCDLMMDAAAQFEAFLSDFDLASPQIPLISNVDGLSLGERATQPAYWAAQLLGTVRFADGITQLIEQDSEQLFVEVGPGHSLCAMVKAAGYRPERIIGSLPHFNKAKESQYSAAFAIGQIWGCGLSFDWQKLYQDQQRGRINLPVYPFERRSYWIAQAPAGSGEFRPDTIVSCDEQISKQGVKAVSDALIQIKCAQSEGADLTEQQLIDLLALQVEMRSKMAAIVGSDFDISASGVELKLDKSQLDATDSQSKNVNTPAKMTAATVTNPRPNTSIEYVQATGKTQQILVKHWQEVLGYKPVGIKDDFFEMGGHSLMVASVIARMRKVFKVDIPLKDLMSTPTIELLADLIDTKMWLQDNQDDDDLVADEAQEVLTL